MRGAGVRGVVLAGFPDFMEKKSSGLVDATMKIESQAAFFLARRRDERTKFGFEEDVLAFLRAQSDDACDRVFRECGDRCGAGTPAGRPLRSFAGFPFGHVGGDCTPNSFNGKENWRHCEFFVRDARTRATAAECSGRSEDRLLLNPGRPASLLRLPVPSRAGRQKAARTKARETQEGGD